MTTSDPAAQRFPYVLTIVAALALSILIGLGAWQLQRLKWKQGVLARIEALKTAPARPLDAALALAARGTDMEWTRVVADCEAAQGGPQGLLYGLSESKVVWRALALCRQVSGAVVLVDRGYVEADRGAMAPGAVHLPAAGRVTGILRPAARNATPATPIDGGYRFAARDEAAPARLANRAVGSLRGFYLVAEREDPEPPGVTPAPLPGDIPNRHLEYALTWFGLAAALTGVYLAMLLRRLRGR